MADDDRRAEIEALAQALKERFGWYGDWPSRVAQEAIDVLDRVRDARGDDEVARVVLDRMIDAAARAGAGGVLPAEAVRQECLRVTYALGSARSPQGEDHGGA